MTLPLKGSRTITINDRVYRWKPSLMRGYSPPMMALVAHEEVLGRRKTGDGPLSTLEVQVYESHCSILTPAVVEALIRGALALGWEPRSSGRYAIGPDETAKHFGGV